MENTTMRDVAHASKRLDAVEAAFGNELSREAPDQESLASLTMAGLPEAAPMPEAPSLARRGRGATINPKVRFDAGEAAPFDDGWNTLAAEFGDLPPLPTTLIRDSSRSVISWNESPDIGFDRA